MSVWGRAWGRAAIWVGVVCGVIGSCSSMRDKSPDSGQTPSTVADGSTDQELDAAPPLEGGASDAGAIDVCSIYDCAQPPVVDAAPPPPSCPTVTSYCAQSHSAGCVGPASLTVGCECIGTWAEALASHCAGFGLDATRYLNCNGFDVIIGASVEFSGIYFYDATTQALVGVAEGGPTSHLPAPFVRCRAGDIPEIDPSTCEAIIEAPCP